MKITIKDVAKAAGVSPSTVSRALHDNNRISPEVRQRVQQVAREMNFHPNQMARSLVNRKTRIVGIVFPGDVSQNLGNPFYPLVLQGLGHAAAEERYHLLLATGSESVSAAEAGERLVQSGYVNGLILLAAEDEPAHHMDVPVVVIGHPVESTSRFFVDNNNVKAGYAAARCLIENGHRRIVFLGFDRRFIFTVDRRRGYEQALREAGIPLREDWVLPGSFLHSPADPEALRRIFLAPDAPTAAVCVDDALAIGLSGAIKQIGLNAPEDVSLVSFNNTEAGRWHKPALTSFDIDPYQLGVSAMKLMLDVLDGRAQESEAIEVPFTLMERESVRDLNQKES